MDITLSNLTLSHLVEELQYLQNGFVNKSQSLENGWVKLKVHTKTFGDKNLVLTPKAFFISSTPLSAKQNPGGFSALLKKYLMNQRIVSLTQHSADRIVIFEFPEVSLVVELFAKGNLILCDKNMKIIKAMRKEEWKDRKLETGEIYKFPSSKGVAPLKENIKDFEKKLKENSKTFFGASVDILNTSPAILEFVFDSLKIDKKKDAKVASSKEIKQALDMIKEIYSSKASKPFVFEGALYTCELGKSKEKEFENINSALNELLLSTEIEKTDKVTKAEEKTVQKGNKFLKEMTAKQAQVEGLGIQESQAQQKGELLYTHYAQVKELLGAVQKAKDKGISEKEIIEKINKVSPLIKELDFKKKKLVVIIK